MNPNIDSGDTSWVLGCSILSQLLLVSGLGLYLSGANQPKDIPQTLQHVLNIHCLVTFIWLLWGYSLTFTPVEYHKYLGAIFGNGSRCWNLGITLETSHHLAPTIPELAFWFYQLSVSNFSSLVTFGGFANRLQIAPMILLFFVWFTIVYSPLVHSILSSDGFMYRLGYLDYAGGTAVHLIGGASSFAIAIVLETNKQRTSNPPLLPLNFIFLYLGLGLAWMGILGLVGGASFSANSRAAFALTNTQISVTVSALSWVLTELALGKVSGLRGFLNGAMTGLIASNAGCGFVDQTGAFFIGFFSGPVAQGAVKLKNYLGFSDSFEAYGLHYLAGVYGLLITGFFATDLVGGANGVFYAGLQVGGTQFGVQLLGVVVASLWSFLLTLLIGTVIDLSWPGGLVLIDKEMISIHPSPASLPSPPALPPQEFTFGSSSPPPPPSMKLALPSELDKEIDTISDIIARLLRERISARARSQSSSQIVLHKQFMNTATSTPSGKNTSKSNFKEIEMMKLQLSNFLYPTIPSSTPPHPPQVSSSSSFGPDSSSSSSSSSNLSLYEVPLSPDSEKTHPQSFEVDLSVCKTYGEDELKGSVEVEEGVVLTALSTASPYYFDANTASEEMKSSFK